MAMGGELLGLSLKVCSKFCNKCQNLFIRKQIFKKETQEMIIAIRQITDRVSVIFLALYLQRIGI